MVKPIVRSRPDHLVRSLLLTAVMVLVASCAMFQANKPALRTTHDIAKATCSAYFGELQGLSLEDAARAFCEGEEAMRPWIDAILAAKQEAGPVAAQRAGVARPAEDAGE
jgi:hypothetical protein